VRAIFNILISSVVVRLADRYLPAGHEQRGHRKVSSRLTGWLILFPEEKMKDSECILEILDRCDFSATITLQRAYSKASSTITISKCLQDQGYQRNLSAIMCNTTTMIILKISHQVPVTGFRILIREMVDLFRW